MLTAPSLRAGHLNKICDNVCKYLGKNETFAYIMKNPDYDQLYQIAESQAGYFTSGQARTAGFSGERLHANTQNQRFVHIQHGIYRLTHFPGSRYEDLFIALLDAGENAVISHETALALFDLSDFLPVQIHLIVPRSTSQRNKSLKLHTNRLQEDEVTVREGLRVTKVERTLVDLYQSGFQHDQLVLAIQEALQRGLISKESMIDTAEKRSNRAKNYFSKIFNQEYSNEI